MKGSDKIRYYLHYRENKNNIKCCLNEGYSVTTYYHKSDIID